MNKQNVSLVVAALALIVAVGAAILIDGREGPQGPPGKDGTGQLGGVTNFDELGLGNVDIDYHSGTLDSGEGQDSWQNTTGKTVYVDYAAMGLIATSSSLGSPTASSSFRAFMATSSSATVTYFAFSEANNNPITRRSIIDGWFIATSTTGFMASSTISNVQLYAMNPMFATATNPFNINFNATPGFALHGSSTDAGDEGFASRMMTGPIPVKSGEYVNIYILNDQPLYGGGVRKVHESATSTARGFNLLWEIRTFATTTRAES